MPMIWIGNDAVDYNENVEVEAKMANYIADLEMKIVRLKATNIPQIIIDRRGDEFLNRVDDNEEGM